jgi:PAS domain S-box-containing protein
LGIGSYAGVPIVLADGEVYGTLCAVDPETHLFSHEDTELMVLLARLIAFQIDRDEIEQKLRASEMRATVLAEVAERMSAIGRQLASSLDTDRVCRATRDTACALTGAELAGIAVPGSDGRLRYTTLDGPDQPEALRYVLPPAGGYSDQAFIGGRTFRIDDVADADVTHSPGIETALGMRSLLVVPLIAHGRPLGVLVVASKGIAAFTGDHQTLLERLADHSAIALDNAAQHRAAVQSEGELRSVLDATSEAIALVAPDRRFISVNRSFNEIFGYSADEIVGRRFDDMTREVVRTFEDPVAFSKLVAGTSEDSTALVRGEFTLRGANRRELELYSVPVHDPEGHHLGRLYVYRDVSREREADRVKSEFVSLVSHELRTPLTSIKGYADLLIEGEAGPVAPEQAEYLGVIRGNADRLVSLVNDLLDVARMDAHKIELARAPIDLVALVRQVTRLMRPQVNERRHRLTLDLPADPVVVSADRDRVVQILTNLLSNALKYTPSGGSIEVALTRDGDAARVNVCDDGIGMTAEEQAQLFTKFFRAKNRATRKSRGTGLGLVIARSLVELHGGVMSVQSVPMKGSTFSFTLPASAASR